jgi:hypothetical protein
MLNLHRLTSCTPVLFELTACMLVRVLLALLLQLRNSAHLYSRGMDMYHRKHISRDHYPASPVAQAAWTYSKHMSHDCYLLLCDVTADMKNTASSIVTCWTMFTELLPRNVLIKSITIMTEVGKLPHWCRPLWHHSLHQAWWVASLGVVLCRSRNKILEWQDISLHFYFNFIHSYFQTSEI